MAIYFTLLVIIRLSGRRTLAQMTPFDLVIVLVISETTQQAMLGDDFSITNAVVLILTLFTTDIGLSYVKRWWPRAAHIIDGVPTVLVTDGVYDERALKGARLQKEDIMQAARSQEGIERVTEIKFAILEVSGNISIIKKQESG
nr:YetF domain-containing protein [Rhizobium ruizarguesonis]